MSLNSSSTGHEGEELAAQYLVDNGMKIIKRNFHFGKVGELDIVAKDGETLVFVEVKYRKSLEYGEPETGLTPLKKRQLKKIAEAYMYINEVFETECRFDVVAILEVQKGHPDIRYYKNAF